MKQNAIQSFRCEKCKEKTTDIQLWQETLTKHFQPKTHQTDKRLSEDVEDLTRCSLNVCLCVLHPDNKEYNFSSIDGPVMKLF